MSHPHIRVFLSTWQRDNFQHLIYVQSSHNESQKTMNESTPNTETFHTPTLSPSIAIKKNIGRLSSNLHNFEHAEIPPQCLGYDVQTFLLFILFLYAAICPNQDDTQRAICSPLTEHKITTHESKSLQGALID